MSLATSIKDFADLLTDISVSKGLAGDFPKALLLQQTVIYVFKAFISLLLYLLSFQWYRDISYLPLETPGVGSASFFASNLLDNPASHIFSFSSPTRGGTDQLFAGLVNSFFFSLPVSLPHLISVWRLFLQGSAAAAASAAGIITAHLLFLIATLYGLRFLIIPYFSLEPWNYVIGVLTVAILVNELVKQKGFKLVPIWDKSSLLKMGALTFLLTWCEETVAFHSLNHLTLNAQNTCFDLYPCTSPVNSFLVHSTYLFAFFVGHSFFSAFFYWLLLKLSQQISSLSGFTTRRVYLWFGKSLLFLIVAFTVSSFPYYGLDYLLTNRAGFLPEDPAYSNTLFSPTQVGTKYPHFFKEITPAQRDQKTPVNLDLNYFDRGMYLNAPKEQKNAVSPIPPPALSFEELNYQGEYAWIVRNELSKDISKMRPSVFTPMFKKPRRRYLELRKLNDNRMEQAARIAHSKIPLGNLTESKEGVLPGERSSLFLKMTDFLGRSHLLPRDVELEMRNFEIEEPSFSDSWDSQNETHNSEKGRIKNQAINESNNPNSALSSSSREPSLPKKMLQTPTRRKNKARDPIKDEFLFESKLQKSYSKGFVPPFSRPYERMRFRYLPVKNVIKKRYFLNNVYKNLLETDIDTFLARQPAAYKLAENQEFQLHQKRQILQKYYNWLRCYQPFEKMVQLRFRIPDSKSFVDRVYHQQFKGTLKIARRLFKVSFDSQQNPSKNRVLSYDQPLYKDLPENENPFLHEELFYQNELLGKVGASKKAQNGAFDQNLLKEQGDTTDSSKNSSPFFEETSSSPTYAGWDPIARRFVVTNRFVLK